MKIAIATDHRGVDIKKNILKMLSNEYEFLDLSVENHPTDDYSDFALAVGKCVHEGNADYGILLCGTGIGMSIAANKVRGIRCALVHSLEEAELSRKHNNANVLALSSNINLDDVIKFIKVFIETDFLEEDKYMRRINKITDYENGIKNEY